MEAQDGLQHTLTMKQERGLLRWAADEMVLPQL